MLERGKNKNECREMWRAQFILRTEFYDIGSEISVILPQIGSEISVILPQIKLSSLGIRVQKSKWI